MAALDIEVHTEQLQQLDLMGKLMDLFHRNDVDVVILNQTTPVLAHEIVRKGYVQE
jgi:hypothetical protein